MNKQFVYLVGPIAGCGKDEANDWRKWVQEQLPDNIVGVSPLRCEPLIGDKYELVYDDPRFGTADAIAAKNEFDTRACDIVLAYLPKYLNERRPSYGSVVELSWASMIGKQVILVSDDPYLMNHPLIRRVTNWRLDNLDDAIDVLKGVLSIYVE